MDSLLWSCGGGCTLALYQNIIDWVNNDLSGNLACMFEHNFQTTDRLYEIGKVDKFHLRNLMVN